MKRYKIKKYIQVLSGKVVDTSLILPHTECYVVIDDKLYAEQIDGSEVYLGKIVHESDRLSDLE